MSSISKCLNECNTADALLSSELCTKDCMHILETIVNVKIGKLSINGKKGDKSFKQEVNSHLFELNVCFENEHKLAHKLNQQYKDEDKFKRYKLPTGHVVAQWTISSQGNVENVSIQKTDTDNKSFEQCIVESISRWHFGEPKNNKTLSVECDLEFFDNVSHLEPVR